MRGEPRNSSSSGAVVLFQFISLGLILAIGSAGNSLVVYAFSRHPRLRRSPYILMVGFVSLDLIRLCLCLAIVFMTVVQPVQSAYAAEMCQWMAFTNSFCLLGNKLSILGMAIDRYIDNRHRALYRRKCRGNIGLALLLAVWILAFLFTFPAVYGGRSSTQKYRLEAKCTFPNHYESTKSQGVVSFLVSLAVSFMLTNLIYFRLFVFLRGRRRMRPVLYEPAVSENWGFYDLPVTNRWLEHSLSDTPIAVLSRAPTSYYDVALWRSKKQKENEKLTKVCFAIHIIFSAMWLPYVVASFCFAFSKSNIPLWAEISATWLTYIQVTITPFTFFSLSGFSRQRIRDQRRVSSSLSSHSSM